eukprot:2736387-Rhodomonas_salina.2
MWISGDEMVKNGCDNLSRDSTVDQHDVRVSEEAWETAKVLAASKGMRLDVDWFADQHNRRLPRFWSREPSVGAEGVDGLRAPCWGRAKCGVCGDEQDHGAWIFPPIRLIPRTVAKMKAERAHGVALVPYHPDKTWWRVLRAACGDGIWTLTVNNCFTVQHLSTASDQSAYTALQWLLCCFDFSADGQRLYPLQCKGAALREPTISPDELGHRIHLRSLLAFAAR